MIPKMVVENLVLPKLSFLYVFVFLRIVIFASAQYFYPTQLFGGKQYIYPDQFPMVPKQLSAKIEMVLTDDKLVEEFVMLWDEDLNIARYDFSLGRIMAPFNITRPMKAIYDYGNGIAFYIDGSLTNCSMYSLGYLLAEANATGSYFKPRRFIAVGNLTLHHLLRTLHPKQLFYLDSVNRAANSTMEIVRGIPCEVWNATIDNYFIPGYGIAKTRHRIYFMSKEFQRFLVGEVAYRIPVQRVVTFLSMRILFPQSKSDSLLKQADKIIFNFFDFTVPIVPTIYDFSISSCIPKGRLETRESFQIRFPGNYSGVRADQFIQPFRREVQKRILEIGEISPIRAVGMYFSQDASNMYITATILPRPPALLHYTMMQSNVKTFLPLPYVLTAPWLDMSAELLGSCASRCIGASPDCPDFGWCSRDNGGTPTVLRRCVIRYNMQVDAQNKLGNITTTEGYRCDVYQRIKNASAYDGAVVESLFKILLYVQERNFTITVKSNTTELSVSAEEMRTDVSLHEDTANPSTSDSRTSFDFYRAQAMIVNKGAKEQFSKLSPAECRQHCLDEKRFTCQSVASCVYGDCIISDLHGDELINNTDGKASITPHSHCAVWTRTWKGMFTLASLLVPKAPPDLIVSGVSNEDTCAKQCLFGNLSCESFSFCSLAMSVKKPGPAKLQHECQLYKHHAFDVMHEERDFKPGCLHLSRNYVNDFEASPGYELYNVAETELMDREIEPALERWHCAKECIDSLGDDGCLAFDVCEDIASNTDDFLAMHEAMNSSDFGAVKCRISSTYIGVLTNTSKKVRVNENCTLYTRTTYLDGTMINPKTVAAAKRDIPLILSTAAKTHSEQWQRSGYSVSDMTGLGIGMLLLGVVVTAACVVIWRRAPSSSGLSFVRDIPFVRLT